MIIPSQIYKIRYDKDSNNYLLDIRDNVDLRLFTIKLNSSEAKNISLAKNNIFTNRLKTHDLVISLLELLSIKIDKIVINKKGDCLLSQIILLKGKKEIVLDAFAVDSIVISLKTFSLLYVDEKLFHSSLKQLNKPFELSDDKKIHKLSLSLKQLIQEENYESAAIIRDKIKEMRNKSN